MFPEIIFTGIISVDNIKTTSGEKNGLLGGAALYSALSASIFAECGIVSVIGMDFPKKYLALISGRINNDGIAIMRGETARFSLIYDKNWNERYIELFFGVSKYLSTELFPENYKQAKMLYIATMPPEKQIEWIDFGKKLGFIVAADTNSVFIEKNRNLYDYLLENTDFFFLNEREAQLLAGVDNEASIFDFLQNYPGCYIVKMGKKGSSIITKEKEIIKTSAIKTDVVDTTGAGDSYAGAFLGAYISGYPLERCAQIANKIASITVSDFGVNGILDINSCEKIV